MLNSLSKRIAVFLLHQNCIQKDYISVYIYGIELFISSLLGVLLVLVSSIIAGNLLYGVLFLASFIFLRLYTGGLHCNSYLACNIVVVITFLAVAFVEKLISKAPFADPLYCIMIIISIAITLTLAPVDNPNKELSDSKKRECRMISVAILLAHFMLHVLFHSFISTGIIIITDFVSSAFIIIGIIKNKTERRIFDEIQKEHS